MRITLAQLIAEPLTISCRRNDFLLRVAITPLGLKPALAPPTAVAFALCAALLSAAANPLWPQVNTEAMRVGSLTPGLHPKVSLDLAMVGGNSKLVNLKGTVRFDYLKGAAHTFLVGSLQQGKSDTLLIINKGFIHLRRTVPLRGRLDIEGFAQNEFNDFINLKERNLLGGGVRIRWRDAGPGESGAAGVGLATGIGFMWEQERITGPQDPEDALKELIRSTNNLVLSWQPDERLVLQTTAYFQFDVARPQDFRVLLDGNLAFALAGRLTATINLTSRYDSLPPAGLNLAKYDVEITSGLAFAF